MLRAGRYSGSPLALLASEGPPACLQQPVVLPVDDPATKQGSDSNGVLQAAAFHTAAAQRF